MKQRTGLRWSSRSFVAVNCAQCGVAFLRRTCNFRHNGVNLCTRACQCKYVHAHDRRWGEEESALLQRLTADGLYVMEIAQLMAWDPKTVARYGGKRPERSSAWSEMETDLLRDMAPHVDLADIAALLGRSVRAIDRRMTNLGVRQAPAFYLGRQLPYHACPPELQEVIRLQRQLKEKLRAEEHRRSA